VLGYEENDEVFIAGCIVKGIDPDCSYIKLKVESVRSLKEQRECERFPVSFMQRSSVMTLIKSMLPQSKI